MFNEDDPIVGSRRHVMERRWPRNAQRAATLPNLLDLSLSSLYLCDEASGNLIDRIGAANLTAAGTPVYGDAVGGKPGVTFNSTTDGFSADVHDLGAASGMYIFAGLITTTPDTTIFGRCNNLGDPCAFVGVSVPASGTLRAIVNGDAAGLLTLSPATDVRGKNMLIILQIDRTATTARLYMKERGGAATTTTGSIAGFDTLTGASQAFGLCNFIPGVTSQPGGFTATLLAVATGAQTEGAGILTSIAERLHF